MPLQITGRHMTISADQRQYIDKKADRLRRLCTKVDEMSITLTREKLHHEAECTFRAGSIAVEATISAEQPLEAIDLLIDKVEAQIRKIKTKRSDKKCACRVKASMQARSMTESLEGSEEEVLEA
ncbi:ribosome-associated translation inhibitor RaiA [bacterium]|nr:ribosome-associated translation inhibitor RaiA [bacterium]